MVAEYPLIVDLDGTLIYDDMFYKSVFWIVRNKPFKLCGLPLKLVHGKAYLKQHIASISDVSPSSLNYNELLLSWLKAERSKGRLLVLCTASDIAMVTPIVDHLGVFDEVMASDGKTNLSGTNKAKALVDRFGDKRFDYCGNAKIDLLVWEHAHNAIVVNAGSKLKLEARRIANVSHTFD